MAVRKRITEKNPRTGALPSEQTAQSNEQQQGGAGSGMLESDRLIYQLVENNVGFAGEQFGENLRFNSEVLTNVLYDNLYDLLGEKLEEDEFVEWLADELVKSGCVTKQESEQEQKPQQQQEPKEEVVYELDDSAYTELKAKVGAAIELIKANRLTIFKLFSDVDNHIKTLSDASDKYELDYDTILLKRRDEEITLLVHRLQSNQQKIEDHILITNDIRDEIDEKVDEVQLAIEQVISDRKKSSIGNKAVIEGLQNTWQKIGENFNGFNKEQEEQYTVFEKPIDEIHDAITKFKGEYENVYDMYRKSLERMAEEREKEGKEKAGRKPIQKEWETPSKQKADVVPTIQPKAQKQEVLKKVKPSNTKISRTPVKRHVFENGDSEGKVVERKIIVTVVPKGMKKPKKEDVIKFALVGKKNYKTGDMKKSLAQKTTVIKPKEQKWKKPVARKVEAIKPREQRKSVVSRVSEQTKNPKTRVSSFIRKAPSIDVQQKMSSMLGTMKPSPIMEQPKLGKMLENEQEKKADFGESAIPQKSGIKDQMEDVNSDLGEEGVSDTKIPMLPVKSPIPMTPVKSPIPMLPVKAPSILGQPSGDAQLGASPRVLTQEKPLETPHLEQEPDSNVNGEGSGIPTTPMRPKVQNGICVCPICGAVHKYGASHQYDEKVPGFSPPMIPQETMERAHTGIKSILPKPIEQKGFIPHEEEPEEQEEHKDMEFSPLQNPQPRTPFNVPKFERKPPMQKFYPHLQPKPHQEEEEYQEPKLSWRERKGMKHRPLSQEFPKKEKKPGMFSRIASKFKSEPQPPKPTLKERIGMKFTEAKWKMKNKIKNRIKESNVVQGFGKVKEGMKTAWGGIKKAGSVIKGVAKAGWNVVKGVTVGAYKAVKGTVKMGVAAGTAFLGASKAVGKAAWGGMKMLGRGLKGMFQGIMEDIEDAQGGKEAGKALQNAAKEGRLMSELNSRFGFKDRGLIAKIANFSGAVQITKIAFSVGWKVLKWAAKMLWKGLKKLASMVVSLFKNLFKFGGKFVNKLSTWLARLGKGIANAAYRFLVKPIANMMVSVFQFFSGLLMAPINFMKWLIPSVFDKIRMVLSYIGQGVKNLLKSTWSIFKKILFNPITIALIIGGIFWIFKDTLMKWLGKGLSGIKNSILPALKSIGEWLWNFVKGAWDIIQTVGSFIFKWVEKITNPDGWIMSTIIKVAKFLTAVMKWIGRMMKLAGKNTIDIFCMYLSGDLLGMAFTILKGMFIGIWRHLKRRGVFAILVGLVCVAGSLGLMVLTLAATLVESLLRAAGALVSWLTGYLTGGLFGGGEIKDVIEQFCIPWKRLWNIIKSIFAGAVYEGTDVVDENHKYMNEDPEESIEDKAVNAKNAVNYLTGAGVEDNLATLKVDVGGSALGKLGAQGLVKKLKNMNAMYQWNAEQTKAYKDFIIDAWNKGKNSDDSSQTVMRLLLESPELSQKLLSVFFYFNPQTEETMTLRPAAFIGQFVKNIQDLVNDPDRDNQEAFKEIIKAFEQLNKERSHLVNAQSDVITDFAERLNSYVTGGENNQGRSEENQKAIAELITKMNKGDLFDKVKYDESFNQIAAGDAQSQDIESITGGTLGTAKLLKTEGIVTPPEGGAPIPRDQFVVKPEPPPPRNKIGRITVPPAMYPPPMPNPDMTNDGKSLYELWLEHQTERDRRINTEGENKAEAEGFVAMTYDEFKDWYKKNNEGNEPNKGDVETEENKAKRLAATKLAANIEAFHQQGVEASADGFKLTGEPTVIQIPMDGLSYDMYMFSPEWSAVQGASGKSDAEFRLDLDAEDAQAREVIRKQKEAEELKKEEERKQREREQAILDYSAKVSKDGYIEIKMGEDVPAMMAAWELHQDKWAKYVQAHGENAAEEAGIHNFTWEEWKPYYRKMHGMPEDGIKRIKLDENMQKKPREIDWSPRAALDVSELQKHGIEMSEEGPVMIPLEKAMAVANQLLAQAKTIYSIRDGLEVMRQGLDTKTKELKEKREAGVPTAVISNAGSGGGEPIVDPVPQSPSDYDGQEEFESRF